MKRLAIFGGSFNPPGLHHVSIVRELLKRFDKVVVVPCGPRPDKATTNYVPSIHRAVMVDLAFAGIDGVEVYLDDLENDVFTTTYELDKRFREVYSEHEIWQVVGADNVPLIQSQWSNGPDLWEKCNFVVCNRHGYSVDESNLPPNSERISIDLISSSNEIRTRAFNHQSISDLVSEKVADYIARYGLYTGRPPSLSSNWQLSSPRAFVVCDKHNEHSQSMVKQLHEYVTFDEENPNVIFVFGGDGVMLHAIRKHWRRRLPFIGFNTGNYGFLLNKAEKLSLMWNDPIELMLCQCPLLYVEIDDGNRVALAFNDAWVERASGQTGWMQVSVNGQVRFGKLMGDGILLATPAGSTAYARAMGASPLLLETPAMQLVGNNIIYPANWNFSTISIHDRVELTTLGSKKRPMRAFVDGVDQGEIEKMKLRISRVASVELAFFAGHDLASKLSEIQFPKKG